MRSFFSLSGRSVPSCLIAGLVGLPLLFVTPRAAQADSIKVANLLPNWALGSPQFALLSGCADTDQVVANCAGGVSDSLTVTIPVLQTASLSLTEADEGAPCLNFPATCGGMLDIRILTANWLFPRYWIWRDNLAEIGPSDYLVLFNFGGVAHALLASNNSDTPAGLPSLDSVFPGVFATLPAPIDLTNTIVNNNGNFTIDLSGDSLTQVPEPGSLVLLGSGLLLAVRTVRTRNGRL